MMWDMSKFLAVGQEFSPSLGLPIKVQEKGEHSTPGGYNNFCDIFDKKGDAWRMIVEHDPARHSFVLRDLVLIELFQIPHHCVTEWTLQAKCLLKLI